MAKKCKKLIKNLLRKKGRMYPSEISEEAKCSYSETMRILKNLEREGLVVRE